MKSGIYSATAGMLTQLEKLNVISNNIANIGTTGYKSDIPFEQVIRFLNEGPYPGKDQPVLGGTEINTKTGSIKMTKRPLDLAIEGKGFFVIKDQNNNTYYSRNGSFNINSKKELVTSDGFNVLDKFNKKIKLFGKSHYFTPKGDLIIDGNYLTTLKIVDIKNREDVKKVGSHFFSLKQGKTVNDLKNPKLSVGALERSNVELMREMTDLITTQRSFEFQKRTLDTVLGQLIRRTITDLPRPI